MKFTLPWLKEHLETGADLETICARLTDLGLEVEGIEDPAAKLADFTVAYVREAVPHPDADRLRVCTVDSATGTRQIVCGAPNARAGLWGILAIEGVTIPANGMVLKASKIRGVESQGMLCSARELALGEDHEGIIELPGEGLEVGMPAIEALSIEGPVVELSITPDRGDCFGVLGIARELAAAGLGSLKPRAYAPVEARSDAVRPIRIDLAEAERAACPVFAGRMITGVVNGPSPDWMQKRLKAIGLRPISALVDITNYLTFDIGRPLHVFDADRLVGGLRIHAAAGGETLEALNDQSYTLDAGMTLISDERGPVSLAGVIGGEGTGCSDGTVNVFLEIAIFDPIRTAATGRKLGIESDARTRFERGLDPALVLPGAEYATRLIQELCGGEAGPLVVAGEVPDGRTRLSLRANQVERLAGIALDAATVTGLLTRLGFSVGAGPESFEVEVPGWRHDVTTEACLVEEVARLYGYGQIPPVGVTRTEAVSTGVVTPQQRRRAEIRRQIAARGYAEAVTWSFIPPQHASLFGAAEPIMMLNPLNAELSAMRPSLLPNLLSAAARNAARKQERGALFEIGPRFRSAVPGDQSWSVAGVRFGMAGERHWAAAARPVDGLDAKGDALAVLEIAGLKADALRVETDVPSWYHPARSGTLGLGPRVIARFGELHPALAGRFDLDGPVAIFEIDLDALPAPKARASRAPGSLPAMPYPPVDRDFAFLVDADLPVDQLVRAVRAAEKSLLRDVSVFDVYAGKGMPEGKKSVAIAIRLQAPDRTLAESEIDPVSQKIIAAVQQATGAELRR